MSAAYRIVLNGAQEIPVVSTAASGRGFAIFDSTANALSYSLDILGLDFGPWLGQAAQTVTTTDDVTDAHFHPGATGVEGGPIFGLKSDLDDFFVSSVALNGSRRVSGRWETTDAPSLTPFLNTFSGAGVSLGGEIPIYINFHTNANPGGEIRGQMILIATDASETVIGTSGDDVLPGLSGDDVINAGAGADSLIGGVGDDTLNGGTGNDVLGGGAGADTLNGDAGDDILQTTDDPADTLTDVFNGGEGQDMLGVIGELLVGLGQVPVITSVEGIVFGGPFASSVICADDFIRALPVNALIRGSTNGASFSIFTAASIPLDLSGWTFENWNPSNSIISINDGSLANLVIGSSQADSIMGMGEMRGGLGDDFYATTSDSALVVEAVNEGVDTIFRSGGSALPDFTLPNNVENLQLGITSITIGIGNALANAITVGGGDNYQLFGLGGDDLLIAQDGSDFLDGGAGADAMVAGAGDDVYAVDDALDVTTELADEGTDSVQSSVTWLLSDHVENLTLTGAAAIDGSGNALANVINGSAAANQLFGLAGDDTLIGGGGADMMGGGGGVDTADYSGSGAGVTVNLNAVTGAGTGGDAEGDTLVSVENVIGSAFNDTLIGRDLFANTLSGGDGNDTLSGGTGGADVMNGGNGIDTLDYSLSPNGVDVRLFSGAASGGAANGDTYSSIENIIGSAAKTDTLAGDANANTIWGGGGNETITGREGADTLLGEAGNDTLLGGADADTLIGGIGADTLGGGAQDDLVDYSASNAGVTVNLQTGLGTGGHAQGDVFVSIEDVTGSEFADVIVGKNNVWDNVFDGRGGNDTYTGGLGNDVFVFRSNSGADTVTDFSASALSNNDAVQLIGFGAAFDSFAEVIAAATQAGAHTMIDFGAGQTLTLQNTTLASLTGGDFILGP